MVRKLKNVTIALDEETARWVRVEAAKRDSSVSKLLGEILRVEMRREAQYKAARRTYLAQEPGVHRSASQPLPFREDLHARPQ